MLAFSLKHTLAKVHPQNTARMFGASCPVLAHYNIFISNFFQYPYLFYCYFEFMLVTLNSETCCDLYFEFCFINELISKYLMSKTSDNVSMLTSSNRMVSIIIIIPA